MFGTYANNVYLLERLDYYCDLSRLFGSKVCYLIMLLYCGRRPLI